MKLIIDIPDSEYNELKGLYRLGLTTPVYKTFIEKTCVEAIQTGTPITEGDLIMFRTLMTEIANKGLPFEEVLLLIDNAKTVVEADKG